MVFVTDGGCKETKFSKRQAGEDEGRSLQLAGKLAVDAKGAGAGEARVQREERSD